MVNSTLFNRGYFLLFFSVFVISLMSANILSVIGVGFKQSEMNYASLNATSGITTGLSDVQNTVFGGFALILVGIVVLGAFGMMQIFGSYG